MEALKALRAGSIPANTVKLDLRNCSLSTLPAELLHVAAHLEILDFSNNPISSLPPASDFPYDRFTKLRIVFFSDCAFDKFPGELSLLPSVEMVSMRHNASTAIPEGSLPISLRWLIYTNNLLTTLPSDIGRCPRLEKVMLAGNRLSSLPESLAKCTKLALLRLSCNQISEIPDWLLKMPALAFLALSGNPCWASTEASVADNVDDMLEEDMVFGAQLGEGASGVIWQADYNAVSGKKRVAVKKFKSTEITSDGSPQDEMRAALLAGGHPNLVSVIGRLVTAGSLPSATAGVVLELVPPAFTNLGLPPTFATCSRDVFSYPDGLDTDTIKRVLQGICAAAVHIHARGIMHGDLYAHNILFTAADATDGQCTALLGDFGAATIYGNERASQFERVEVLAFAHLVDDLMSLVQPRAPDRAVFEDRLKGIWSACASPRVADRPSFREVQGMLESL